MGITASLLGPTVSAVLFLGSSVTVSVSPAGARVEAAAAGADQDL